MTRKQRSKQHSNNDGDVWLEVEQLIQDNNVIRARIAKAERIQQERRMQAEKRARDWQEEQARLEYAYRRTFPPMLPRTADGPGHTIRYTPWLAQQLMKSASLG